VSEARIGLLLVVCLVGALGYLTYQKLEDRRHKPFGPNHDQPAAADDSGSDVGPPPAGEQNGPSPGEVAGWAAGPGDEPGFADDSGDPTSAAGPPDFISSPPAQQEPENPISRIVANHQSMEFRNDQPKHDHQARPEAQPLTSDSEPNPFAADAPLESSQPHNAAESQQAGVSGAGDTPFRSGFDASPDEAPGWLDNPRSEPAAVQATNTAEIITSVDTRSRDFDTESEEVVGDLFGGDSQPIEPAAADADIVVESSERPLPEPLLVPADDARVIPVASDEPVGDVTQRAAVETANSDPWGSPTPREMAPNGNESAVELDFGGASSNPDADSATGPASEPGFLPEPGEPTGSSVETWNDGSNGASASTTAGFDPFSESTANDSTLTVGSDEITIHIVQSGDNFWTIAHKHYQAGRYANALAAFNQSRIPDPRKMRPGMKVLVPGRQVLVRQFPKLTGAAYGPGLTAGAARSGFFVDRNGQPAYRVGKNDTLTGIASRHLGRSSRWVQVLGMNRDQLKDGNSLKIGMVLKLPLDATPVSVVTETAIAR
jgi:nucleoid-associated protein YgaU